MCQRRITRRISVGKQAKSCPGVVLRQHRLRTQRESFSALLAFDGLLNPCRVSDHCEGHIGVGCGRNSDRVGTWGSPDCQAHLAVPQISRSGVRDPANCTRARRPFSSIALKTHVRSSDPNSTSHRVDSASQYRDVWRSASAKRSHLTSPDEPQPPEVRNDGRAGGLVGHRRREVDAPGLAEEQASRHDERVGFPGP
jgi:hypothetical protein